MGGLLGIVTSAVPSGKKRTWIIKEEKENALVQVNRGVGKGIPTFIIGRQ